jgi:hypothetical protein
MEDDISLDFNGASVVFGGRNPNEVSFGLFAYPRKRPVSPQG